MGNELKQMGTGIKETYDYHASTLFNQQAKDFGNYLANPERIEDGLLFFGPGKFLKGGKGNLLKVEANTAPAARTAIQAEVSSSVTTGAALAEKYQKNRPKHYQKNINAVWESSKKADGKVYDPNSGRELSWDKMQTRNGQWDMGHIAEYKYEFELTKLKEGKISEKQFLKNYHNSNNFRAEGVPENRGRKNRATFSSIW
jgi:hypothetical protein